jgi:hypothetical protein
MKIIHHSNLMSIIRKTSPAGMQAECALISTDFEAVARIRTDYNMVIQQADWDIYRAPGGKHNKSREVAELTGVRAYLDCGPALRPVGDKDGAVPYELLAECVKGIIQCESFFYKERGFASQEEFEKQILEKSYHNSCRQSSTRDRQVKTWFEYIDERKWGDLLFTRCRSVTVRQAGEEEFLVSGDFNDSFHELGMNIVISGGLIADCSGNFLRTPEAVCEEAMELLGSIRGAKVAELTKRRVGQCVGGPMGCDHMFDLLNHMLKVWRDSAERQPFWGAGTGVK